MEHQLGVLTAGERGDLNIQLLRAVGGIVVGNDQHVEPWVRHDQVQLEAGLWKELSVAVTLLHWHLAPSLNPHHKFLLSYIRLQQPGSGAT